LRLNIENVSGAFYKVTGCSGMLLESKSLWTSFSSSLTAEAMVLITETIMLIAMGENSLL